MTASPLPPPPGRARDAASPLGFTRVHSSAQIGAMVRAYRERHGLDQATTAGLAGVGVRFLGELERGKPTVRLGLVLQVLNRLGLEVWISPRRPPPAPPVRPVPSQPPVP